MVTKKNHRQYRVFPEGIRLDRRLPTVGTKFYALTVLKENGVDEEGRTYLCECECGTQLTTSGYRLWTGKIEHCGCNPWVVEPPTEVRRYKGRLC